MNLIASLSKRNNLFKITMLSLAITSTLLTGCDSENNSAELARAVELEKQRMNGTIIESVIINNAQTRLKATETHQLTATGIDTKGEVREVTKELIWTSSDNSIATVDSNGLVTGVANSDIDQGKVIITGTTINDISSDGEMSISDAGVSAIALKQTSPEIGNIQTCIEASIQGDVSYEDGYLSLNTVKDMTFTVDDETTAIISEDGTLYTSAEGIENTTITSTIGDVNARLTVTADPKDLDSIDVLYDDEIVTIITLNIGDRIQVNAQANLIESVSEDTFDINSSIDWQQRDTGLTGITETGVNKGTILALKPGLTELTGSCGGKEAEVILEVKGEATLEGMQINVDGVDAEGVVILEPLKSVELTLTAIYETSPTNINVSEFSNWSSIGKDIVEIELISAGTKEAHYKLTSTSISEGSVVLSIVYDGFINSLRVEIEN